ECVRSETGFDRTAAGTGEAPDWFLAGLQRGAASCAATGAKPGALAERPARVAASGGRTAAAPTPSSGGRISGLTVGRFCSFRRAAHVHPRFPPLQREAGMASGGASGAIHS